MNPEPPSPVPSPPPLDNTFLSDLDVHHIFFGYSTRLGHHIDACSATSFRDWGLILQGRFLQRPDRRFFSTRDLPPHLLPFFAYKDAAIYEPSSGGCGNGGYFFRRIYQEWYPTRDRNVFNHGVKGICGAPFFSSTARVDFKYPALQPEVRMGLVVCWHVALSRRLQKLLPRFRFFDQIGKTMVRPGLTEEELQAVLGSPRAHIEYSPVMRRTFSQCFLWVEQDWEEHGVRLAVLDEDMLRRVSSLEGKGMTRDIEMEEQVKKAVETLDIWEEGDLDEHANVDLKAVFDQLGVWRGELEDVMRAVVGGDGERKPGLRDFNAVLEEWVGDGVYVKNDGRPLSDDTEGQP